MTRTFPFSCPFWVIIRPNHIAFERCFGAVRLCEAEDYYMGTNLKKPKFENLKKLDIQQTLNYPILMPSLGIRKGVTLIRILVITCRSNGVTFDHKDQTE